MNYHGSTYRSSGTPTTSVFGSVPRVATPGSRSTEPDELEFSARSPAHGGLDPSAQSMARCIHPTEVHFDF